MNEGGFVFVEGVKLSEPEYPKGVKLTEVEVAKGVKLAEPDLLIAWVNPVHIVFSIYLYVYTSRTAYRHTTMAHSTMLLILPKTIY